MSGSVDTRARVQEQSSLTTGVLYGVASFVAGYVALYLLKGSEIQSKFLTGFTSTGASVSQLQQMGGSLPQKWQLVGMKFFATHNAKLEMVVSARGRQFSRTVSPSFFSGDPLPWLIPMAALVAGGFLLVRGAGRLNSGVAAKRGAGVTAGYLPAAAIGVFAFEWQTSVQSSLASASLSLGPELTSAVLFAGVVYPVVFGALGGVLAAEL